MSSVRVTVQYPARTDARFDWDYYMTRHVPMVSGLFEGRLERAEVFRGLGGAGGSPPPHLCSAHLYFPSMETFQQAFGEHAARIMSDVANYTNVEPLITIERAA
jgi:uncharacterized protein (TIGR02118 family)